MKHHRHLIVGLLCTLPLICFCNLGFAGIIRVDHESSTNGPGTSSWSNAFDNIQDALDYAVLQGGSWDVWIADGEYIPTALTDIYDPASATFMLLPNVKIFGGFQGLSRTGGGETMLIQRNPEVYETILSGEIGDPYDLDDNIEHIVTASGDGIDDDVILSGVTIRAGGYSGEYGALLITGDAWPVVARCKIVQCHIGALVEGSPVGPVQFLAGTFTDNYSVGVGKGACIWCRMGTENELIVANCVAYDNQAGGGAFLRSESATSIINCTIARNTGEASGDSGAALRFVGDADRTVINCIISGNTDGDGQVESAQINTPVSGTIDVRNCDIQGLDHYAGNCNIDVDPLFVDSGSDDFRLMYHSLVLNNGDASYVPVDTYDIDDDSVTTGEPLPDRSMAYRKVNPSACCDIGAFENQVDEATCEGDIDSAVSRIPDGVVNVVDLLAVIDAWGTPGGIVDFYPSDCGDGTVDVNELLAVINNWGTCETPASPPETLEDCWTDCYAEWPENEEKFWDCYFSCVNYLCEHELIDCDE